MEKIFTTFILFFISTIIIILLADNFFPNASSTILKYELFITALAALFAVLLPYKATLENREENKKIEQMKKFLKKHLFVLLF